MKISKLSLAAFVLTSSVQTAAIAAPVSATISGFISSIYQYQIDFSTNAVTPLSIFDPAVEPFNVGDSFSVHLDLSNATGPTPALIGVEYNSPFSATFGNLAVSGPQSRLTIVNNGGGSGTPIDWLNLAVFAGTPTFSNGTGKIAGLSFGNVTFNFRDDTGTAFADALLSTSKFDAAIFSTLKGSIAFSGSDPANPQIARGIIFDLQPTRLTAVEAEVPLPASIFFLLSGLASLGAVSRKRRTSAALLLGRHGLAHLRT